VKLTENFSILKNFPDQGAAELQFPFESFAFFNHSNFDNLGAPATSPAGTAQVGTASLGNITYAAGNWNIQLAPNCRFKARRNRA
jgi:hypothetical protein